MTVAVSHLKVSTKPPAADPTEVGGPDWNAGHVITGLAAVAGTGAASDLTGLAAIATSGAATDLTGTLPAARMPALTGDVTTSAGGVSTTIAGNAVTHAKMAQLSGLTLVGNATGSTANRTELTVAQVVAMLGIRLGDFGNGRDGTVTMDGSTTVAGCSRSGSTYTATRTCFFDSLTINSGVTFKPDGWPIYVRTLLTNNGIISCDGGDASGATDGTAAVSGTRLLPTNLSVGNNSSSAPQVFVASSAANNGVTAGGAGTAGASGTAGTVGRGGGGGAGGNNNPFTAQGASGNSAPTVALSPDSQGDVANKIIALRGVNLASTSMTLGTAGGQGGAGGAGTQGGGRGMSGGWVAIVALAVAGTGVWRSRGGNGGAGTGSIAGFGGAGGGGGGSGGLFVLELGGGTAPTIDVSGGSGGSGGPGGSGGAGNGGGGGGGGAGYALVI